jgi:hypothetical protein
MTLKKLLHHKSKIQQVISKIHKVIGDTLDKGISIDDLEAENAKLKEKGQRIGRSCPNATSYSCKPFGITKPGTPNMKLKGSSSLLMVVRKFVEENIKKIMSLIMEAWEVSNNIVSFGS